VAEGQLHNLLLPLPPPAAAPPGAPPPPRRDPLTEAQQHALHYAAVTSHELHHRALQETGPAGLVARCAGLGYTPTQLNAALAHVEHAAPIIIHLRREALEALQRDMYYRSTVETGLGGGGGGGDEYTWQRVRNEREIFGGAYAEGTPFSEYPVYAVSVCVCCVCCVCCELRGTFLPHPLFAPS
jgi:hypothetical protein